MLATRDLLDSWPALATFYILLSRIFKITLLKLNILDGRARSPALRTYLQAAAHRPWFGSGVIASAVLERSNEACRHVIDNMDSPRGAPCERPS